MSITDELRERIDAVCRVSGWDCKRLIAIADRIDSEHEEALREAYTKGREDGIGVANKADMRAEYLRGRNDGWDEGYDAGFASADDWCAQHEGAMAEHGWYRALDGDKKPIRFNDDMEWELLGSGDTERGYVVGIKIDLIADRQSCRVKVVRDSDFQTIELMAKNLHHVKPAELEPTVEDMLQEFVNRWMKATCYQEPDLIAEYAAKLRLAGDAE